MPDPTSEAAHLKRYYFTGCDCNRCISESFRILWCKLVKEHAAWDFIDLCRRKAREDAKPGWKFWNREANTALKLTGPYKGEEV